jgi:dihydrofolate synthase/folylpolyglutamate synthase
VKYPEATRYLYALAPRGVKLGLARMEEVLAQRGHPERTYPSIVVAGTNGKGSVSAMLASVLRASGLRVGLFTSPHLHRLVERFQIDGRPVSQREFARRVTELAPFLERTSTPPLTFFEVCTLLAFELFRDAGCEVAVLEVGLGGRLDSTNVVTPQVSVITRIAMDHADQLGSTLGQIAREKAGIIKPGVPVIVGVREPEALAVITRRARAAKAPLRRIDRDFSARREPAGFAVRLGERQLERLRLPLAGDYQRDNLACAVAALASLSERGFPGFRRAPRGASLDLKALRRGLRRVRWPGRLELLPGSPAVLLDAAHNPDACEALVEHLRAIRPGYRKLVLLFGVLADKEYERMLELLLPAVEACVFATPGSARALPAERLGALFPGSVVVADPLRALARARKLAGARGLVVVAGSIFLMARVRASLLGKSSDPPIAL